MKKKIMIITAIAIVISALCLFAQNKKCYAAEDTKIVINSIDSDIKREVLEDAYDTEDLSAYDTQVIIHKEGTETREDIKVVLPYGKSVDCIKYITEELNIPNYFEDGKEYTIVLGAGYNVKKEKVEGIYNEENITVTERTGVQNEYQYSFVYHNDDKININLISKVLGAEFKFAYEGITEEGEEDYFKPEYVNVKIDLGSTKNNPNNYFKLVNDDNGNLTYEYVKTAHGENNKDFPAPSKESGLVDFIRINKDKMTTIITPYGTGAEWRFYAARTFEPGEFGGEFGSSTGALNIRETLNRVFTIKSRSKYGIKTINKTDVKGNPVDASYEVYFNNLNKREDEKFVFKHYDTKTIKGIEYKNVYEVVGSTDLDDNSSESVLSTKDGNLTLYYPLYHVMLPYYFDFEEPYNLKIAPSGGSQKIYEISFVEKSADSCYVVDKEPKTINLREDEQDTYSFVNKKKPTVTEILDDDAKYDGEFIFEVYDVETGKLVGTARAKTGITVALEPKVTDENGITTGYLEDGKKYRVIKKEVENIINYDVKTNKGLAEKNEINYVEFVFNSDLNDLCDIVFYDKQAKVEEPIVKEEKTEDPKNDIKIDIVDVDDNKDEMESPQTSDLIALVTVTLILSVVGFGITFVKFKK